MAAGNIGSGSCGIPLSYTKALPLATSFFLDHSVFINDLKLPVEIRRSEIIFAGPGSPDPQGRTSGPGLIAPGSFARSSPGFSLQSLWFAGPARDEFLHPLA